MAGKFISLKFPAGQVQKWANKAQRENDKAVSATLNELSKVGIRKTSKQLQDETGVNQSSVRRRIRVIRASIYNHVFTWFVSGKRLSWIQPRVLRGGDKKPGGNRIGLSHLADNKVRKRVTGSQNGGSAPFLAKLNVVRSEKTGKVTKGNKIAVYKDKSGRLNKLVGHSLPWLLKEDWITRIKERLVNLMPEEYKKQLKKSKFRK